MIQIYLPGTDGLLISSPFVQSNLWVLLSCYVHPAGPILGFAPISGRTAFAGSPRGSPGVRDHDLSVALGAGTPCGGGGQHAPGAALSYCELYPCENTSRELDDEWPESIFHHVGNQSASYPVSV